ncbi:hypothetical protein [Nitratireductor pacificus]|uniref:Uncharacterized protein n=1 Tax=Nitratireductor pacificus pht-3B TaxID=391937 RepID=K2MD28_9HYPH|nr:hypothetical protein [Nitratireductor pacificus]EKF18630.1 hypothetical protein NA2_12059 [Nitratireductor pacificus pht-3B]
MHQSFQSAIMRIVQAPGAGRPFLASLDAADRRNGQTIVVHAARSAMSREQARELRRKLGAVPGGARVRVCRHGAHSLSRAKSLEAFLQPFAHDRIVYDPTGVFERGTRLVALARAVRRVGGDSIRHVLWHSATGSLHLVLNARHLPASAHDRSAHLALVERILRSEIRKIEAAGDQLVKAVRIGLQPPRLPATPIDVRSVHRPDTPWTRFGRRAYIAFMAAGFGFGAAAARADDTQHRAVSGFNGELSVMGGVHDGEGAGLVEGAIVAPLGDRFGTRWDGVAGTIDGQFVGGGAAHLFWRDPGVGLVGLAGGYVRADGAVVGTAREVGIIAAEGEVYFNQLTVAALAGYQFSDHDEGFVGRLDFEWYLTDDLMLVTGVETNPQVDWLGRFGAEYRPGFDALPGLSLFAEGAVGTNDYNRAFAGIRFYFGQSETLKERHRNDTFRSHLLPTRMLDGLPSTGTAAYGE